MKKKYALAFVVGVLTFMTACQAENLAKDLTTIDVVSREQGSGTRTAFEELLEINTDRDNMMKSEVGIKDGNGLVATYVAENNASIGYVSFATLEANKDKVHGLSIDAVSPTAENVLNGTYSISRPFVMVYKEEYLTDSERAFIDFLASNQGLQSLESAETIVDYANAQDFDVSKYGDLTGNMVLGGSTSTENAIKAAAVVFKALFPNVTYTYAATGSGAGITNAQDGTYTIGFASREIKESELATELQATVVCRDGIVFIVNNENEIDSVSSEQIRDIYSGRIESWSELFS